MDEWCRSCGEALYEYLKRSGVKYRLRRKVKWVNEMEKLKEMFMYPGKVLLGKLVSTFVVEGIYTWATKKFKELPEWGHILAKVVIAWFVWDLDEDVASGFIIDAIEDTARIIIEKFGGEKE